MFTTAAAANQDALDAFMDAAKDAAETADEVSEEADYTEAGPERLLTLHASYDGDMSVTVDAEVTKHEVTESETLPFSESRYERMLLELPQRCRVRGEESSSSSSSSAADESEESEEEDGVSEEDDEEDEEEEEDDDDG